MTHAYFSFQAKLPLRYIFKIEKASWRMFTSFSKQDWFWATFSEVKKWADALLFPFSRRTYLKQIFWGSRAEWCTFFLFKRKDDLKLVFWGWKSVWHTFFRLRAELTANDVFLGLRIHPYTILFVSLHIFLTWKEILYPILFFVKEK